MAQQAEWFVAQDTFNAELPTGGNVTIQKGSTHHRSTHVVGLDAGRNYLFQPQETGDEAPAPAKRSRNRAARSSPAGPAKGAPAADAGDGGGS